jgi:uncharacterized membrane protein YbhN (UPF0104 family)
MGKPFEATAGDGLPAPHRVAPYLQFVLRGAISAALVIFILRTLDWGQVSHLLARTDFRWAVCGWLLTFLVISSLAFRWLLFIRQQHLFATYRDTLALTWAGQFFNSLLPGSTGGDVVKIVQLCRRFPDRKAGAVASVVIDRFVALIALLIWAGVGFARYPSPLQVAARRGMQVGTMTVWSLIIILAGGFGAAIWMLFHRRSIWRMRFVAIVRSVLTNLTSARRLFTAGALAIAIHFVNFLLVYCFARALGISITLGQVLLIMPVVLFVVLLPVTVNGHGLREILLIYYFGQLGVIRPGFGVQETVVALSLICVLNDVLWCLPGGIWYAMTCRGVVPDQAVSAT